MSTFSPPEPPRFATGSPRERAARIVTDVLALANLVIALLVVIGAHTGRGWAGAGWGLLAALFCGVLPIGLILRGVRRGRLTDRHIRVRRQRLVPMAASLLCVLAGLAVLGLLDAPRAVLALVVAMLVGLLSSLAVTVRWQISIHNSVAGGTAAVLLLAFGPVAVPALALPVAIGWSRLVLRAHTPAQVVTGTALGGVCGLVFALLR
ncbi:phosphatase PAP2 family protein [Kitasatospora paranensis]|uniref:Phosphatase PAP2 family protein n=1 Tax=Kitasatospora paranensis TaxID=258053 RepID=A0ABW2GBU0_9ACTN